jgi:hypothetical protein
MMDVVRSSETSLLTRATRRNIPEEGTLLDSRKFSKTSNSVLLLIAIVKSDYIVVMGMERHFYRDAEDTLSSLFPNIDPVAGPES